MTGAQTRLVEQTSMRRSIAKRMSESKRDAPHFYISTQLEVDNVLARLERLNAARGRTERISVTAFLVHACARTLAQHVELNAVWTPEGLALVEQVNISVAIATKGGVIAPALLGCEELSLGETSTALGDLIARTRGGTLRGGELTDGTFTASNLGMFPVAQFTAIVTPPQVAVLATGTIDRVPRLDKEMLVERSLITATVSADHRAVDGADVAAFLGTLKETVERAEERE